MIEETENAPHAPCGCARLHGAFAADRCGAKRRDGGACQQPAMRNGRCRLHGGKSTGARTPGGKAKAQAGNLKHGRFSADAITERRELRRVLHLARRTLRDLAALA
ncbi:HGGxSTG domain-containing protein [Methylobacterium sp. WL103]|uniref:HGGxSTG domain-containing protein n=1 Tax=Methylobacterium sp. WL103 TaxID=2603891 RepID=UPI002484CC06|nr:HGGxSTG domain-containing protein [Methylobacterium sp. WL103]